VVRAQRIARDARTEAEMAAFAASLEKAMQPDADTPDGHIDVNGALDRIFTVVEQELGTLFDGALASLTGRGKRQRKARPKALRGKESR
jgi:hypothetical protein